VDFTAASSMSHMIRSSGREYRGKCVRAWEKKRLMRLTVMSEKDSLLEVKVG
jgi:hypothetical protein